MAQQKPAEPADEVEDLIDELQPGSKLLKGQYTITRYLNSGGFGITYLAKDSLDRDVVIKECFPSSVCRRSKVVVAARSRAHTAELRSIVQLFVREARSLAKIVHPNIVSVHNVFEDNGTAYMALDYIDGLDLQQVIDGEGEPLAPEHIVEVTEKLLHAVGFIHDHDMLHRDISPDNVLIDKTGKPILIDFGAAREHASKTTRAMSALRVVKDGYSPQEFYIAGSDQGPWSDLYALGATIYHLISGEAPVNGQARLAALAEDRPDPYVPLAGRFPAYPPGFLEAIDRALQTLPKQRWQTAAEWLEMYHKAAPAPVAAAPVPAATTGEAPIAEAPAGVDDAVHRLLDDFKREESTQGEVVVRPSRPLAKAASRAPEVAGTAAPAARGKSPVQLVAGIAVALVVLAGGYVMLGGNKTTVAGDATAKTSEPAATKASEPVATKTSEPAVTTTASVTPGVVDTAPKAEEKVEPSAPETSAGAATETTAASAVVTDTASAETTAPEPATPDVDTAPDAPADTASAQPDPAATTTASAEPATETAAAQPAAADPTPETEAQPEETTEAEATTEAGAPTAAPAAAGPAPAANQIALAVWDVELPFTADDRIIGGEPLTIVQSLTPGFDRASTGGWLQQGLLIYGVNGMPTPNSNALTTAILNAMRVDPDGKARFVVEYAGSNLKRRVDLLTVEAVRLVNLSNGVSVRASVENGVWTSMVTAVADPQMTTLKSGDVLFRDLTTEIPLDAPDALEKIMADLIAQGRTETGFSVIRNNKVNEATMQLRLANGQ